MAVHSNKIVDAVSYSAGTGQFINVPPSHRACKHRFIQINKVSGTGTLDLHPLEFSVDGSVWATAFSVDGVVASGTFTEQTNITTNLIALDNAMFPFIRLKVDVNTNPVVITVTVCNID